MAERPRRVPAREVRRLLADARHSEPMPVDVAGRLDRVIAHLAGQQATEPHEPAAATVTELAARRRRRVTSLLVAATAAVAIGVGVDQLASSSSSSSSTSSSASRSLPQQQQGASGDQQDGPQSFGKEGSGSAGSGSASAQGRPNGEVPVTVAVRVRADHFTTDAARARRLAGSSGALDSVKGTRNAPRSAYTCERADWGRGRVVPVRYQHLPAVLVLRPPTGDSQVVDLFRCGTTDLLRSTTLPSH